MLDRRLPPGAPPGYRFIRTTLAGTTALALIGFASFTLMPPRLLGDTSPYGACPGHGADCHGYGIVDTIDVWGGLWKFGEGGMAAVSNQYAAMPSLHIGWSTWCALSMVLVIGRGRKRYLWFLYPATTFFCILVTGNHYWLDAFFGVVALAGGTLIALARASAHGPHARRVGRQRGRPPPPSRPPLRPPPDGPRPGGAQPAPPADRGRRWWPAARVIPPGHIVSRSSAWSPPGSRRSQANGASRVARAPAESMTAQHLLGGPARTGTGTRSSG